MKTETTSGVVPRRGWLYASYFFGAITGCVFLSAIVYPYGEVEASLSMANDLPLLRMPRGEFGRWIAMVASGVLVVIFCQWQSERPRRKRDETTINISGFSVAEIIVMFVVLVVLALFIVMVEAKVPFQ